MGTRLVEYYIKNQQSFKMVDALMRSKKVQPFGKLEGLYTCNLRLHAKGPNGLGQLGGLRVYPENILRALPGPAYSIQSGTTIAENNRTL